MTMMTSGKTTPSAVTKKNIFCLLLNTGRKECLMTQIKIFESTDITNLQERVNNFLTAEIDGQLYYSLRNIEIVSRGDKLTATVIYDRPTF